MTGKTYNSSICTSYVALTLKPCLHL